MSSAASSIGPGLGSTPNAASPQALAAPSGGPTCRAPHRCLCPRRCRRGAQAHSRQLGRGAEPAGPQHPPGFPCPRPSYGPGVRYHQRQTTGLLRSVPQRAGRRTIASGCRDMVSASGVAARLGLRVSRRKGWRVFGRPGPLKACPYGRRLHVVRLLRHRRDDLRSPRVGPCSSGDE